MGEAERSAIARGEVDELLEIRHLAHEHELGVRGERRKVDVRRGELRGKLGHRQRPLLRGTGVLLARGLAQKRADAGVRVLDVVDRVARVLLLGDLDVEVDRLVGGARQHQKPGRVHADLVDELGERHHLARALGHAHGLAVAEQVDELAEHHLERAGVAPCLEHRLAALHVAVVVGAPDVDQVVETAHELVMVIGHVANEVRHLAVLLDEDAVLVIAECRGAEPGGAILLEKVALLVHRVQSARHRGLPRLIGHVERALREPAVEMHAEAAERVLHQLQHLAVRHLAKRRDALGVGHRKPLVAVAVDDALGDVGHVRSAVALLGHLDVAAEQLLVADGHGVAEHVHLDAVVVDVELLGHVVARMAHHARHRVAERRPAAMAHMHGAGGVGRDVLEVDAARLRFGGALAEAVPLGADLRDHALERRGGQADVDETGASDLDGLDELVFRQMVDDDLGDLAGIALGLLGAAHGDGGRPIAVGLVARTLQPGGRRLFHGEGAILACGGDGRVDDLLQLFANLHDGESFLLRWKGPRERDPQVLNCAILSSSPADCAFPSGNPRKRGARPTAGASGASGAHPPRPRRSPTASGRTSTPSPGSATAARPSRTFRSWRTRSSSRSTA